MTLFTATFLATLIVGSLLLTAAGVVVLVALFVRDLRKKTLW